MNVILHARNIIFTSGRCVREARPFRVTAISQRQVFEHFTLHLKTSGEGREEETKRRRKEFDCVPHILRREMRSQLTEKRSTVIYNERGSNESAHCSLWRKEWIEWKCDLWSSKLLHCLSLSLSLFLSLALMDMRMRMSVATINLFSALSFGRRKCNYQFAWRVDSGRIRFCMKTTPTLGEKTCAHETD